MACLPELKVQAERRWLAATRLADVIQSSADSTAGRYQRQGGLLIPEGFVPPVVAFLGWFRYNRDWLEWSPPLYTRKFNREAPYLNV